MWRRKLRHPARRQLDHADAQAREALEHAVQDQVGEGDRRRQVQEDRVEELLAVLVLPGSPGGVQRALELRDVEDRRNAFVAERRPHGIEVRVRQRLPVHRGRGDHGQAHALRPHPPDLLHRPGRIVQQDVGHAEEPALALAAHVGDEAVVGPCVGALGVAVRRQPLLPQQAVVREQDRGIESERVERRERGHRPGGRSRAPARRTTPALARRAAGAGGPPRSASSAPGSAPPAA